MVGAERKLKSELDELLSESVASAKRRESTAFEDATRLFGNQIVLSGAGNLGRKVLKALRTAGIEPLAFVDNKPSLWGTSIDGLSVYPQSEGADLWGKSATFCITIWQGDGTSTMAERCKPLADLGCLNVIDFGCVFWKFSDLLLPHYSLDLPHKVLMAAEQVRAGFEVWHDDASRAEYVAQIRWRLRLDFDNLPSPVADKLYFPESMFHRFDDEVFVDCGAYNGDTIQDFLIYSDQRFRRIYAFEADRKNFVKLESCLESLPVSVKERIRPFCMALGERAGVLRFDSTGTAAASVSSLGVDVDCVALDGALPEPPTFIKMDIEGSEPAALRGAHAVIKQFAPILSVCVYHSQDHLWSVPLQIGAIHPGYKMMLRPHLRESWDLVCYAVPPARLAS